MSDFSQKLLDRIRHDGIEPEARWRHLLRHLLVWIAAAGSIILGILSVAIIALSMVELDEHILSFRMGRMLPPLLFLPPFWLILASLSFILAIIALRNTRHGYRHRAIAITGITFFLLVSGALFLHATGLSKIADSSMRGRVPGHPSFEEKRMEFWSKPENGFIAGKIIDISSPDFSIRDLDGNIWIVRVTRETEVRPKTRISSDEMVKIIGKIEENNSFVAEDIRPWEKSQPKKMLPNKKGEPTASPEGHEDSAF